MESKRSELHQRLEEFIQRLMSCVHSEGLDQLVELDLSMSQARVMFTVAEQDEPIAINEIAAKIGLSVAATGRTIDSLVKLGTLERRESTEDRRIKLIGLTARGFSAIDQQMEHKRAALRQFADRLNTTEAGALNRVLGQILAGDSLRTTEKDAHV